MPIWIVDNYIVKKTVTTFHDRLDGICRCPAKLTNPHSITSHFQQGKRATVPYKATFSPSHRHLWIRDL